MYNILVIISEKIRHNFTLRRIRGLKKHSNWFYRFLCIHLGILNSMFLSFIRQILSYIYAEQSYLRLNRRHVMYADVCYNYLFIYLKSNPPLSKIKDWDYEIEIQTDNSKEHTIVRFNLTLSNKREKNADNDISIL